MRHSFNGNYRITRPFGVKGPAYAAYPGSRHPGTDYGLPADTVLVAGMFGSVINSDRPANIHKGRGKEVVITFGNKQRKTCHMNRIDVRPGQLVTEGQPIGLSGYTGYVVDAKGRIGTPGGAHLHDELLIDGQYVDLEKYLNEGEEMGITPNQLDKLIKMAKRAEPTAEELSNQKYLSDPGLAIDTFWNTWGKANYAEDQKPKTYVRYTLPELYVKGQERRNHESKQLS